MAILGKFFNEFFIPIKTYHHSTLLKCDKNIVNNITSAGRIITYKPTVCLINLILNDMIIIVNFCLNLASIFWIEFIFNGIFVM